MIIYRWIHGKGLYCPWVTNDGIRKKSKRLHSIVCTVVCRMMSKLFHWEFMLGSKNIGRFTICPNMVNIWVYYFCKYGRITNYQVEKITWSCWAHKNSWENIQIKPIYYKMQICQWLCYNYSNISFATESNVHFKMKLNTLNLILNPKLYKMQVSITVMHILA